MNTPTALIITLLLALFAPVEITHAKQPNVLLIITDDQGYGDFAIHGNTHLQTPHLDQLAAESVRFDRFYVNSFCAPTRALSQVVTLVRVRLREPSHSQSAMRFRSACNRLSKAIPLLALKADVPKVIKLLCLLLSRCE